MSKDFRIWFDLNSREIGVGTADVEALKKAIIAEDYDILEG